MWNWQYKISYEYTSAQNGNMFRVLRLPPTCEAFALLGCYTVRRVFGQPGGHICKGQAVFLKTKRIGFPETSVANYKSTLCNIPELRRSRLLVQNAVGNASFSFDLLTPSVCMWWTCWRLRTELLWVITQRVIEIYYRRFGTIYRPPSSGVKNPPMMKRNFHYHVHECHLFGFLTPWR
jgi:hypothetical protein